MCMGSPKLPPAPDPVIIPPEQEKKLELNPESKKSKSKKAKRLGTRKLQIPMGGKGTGSSGLNIPR